MKFNYEDEVVALDIDGKPLWHGVVVEAGACVHYMGRLRNEP